MHQAGITCSLNEPITLPSHAKTTTLAPSLASAAPQASGPKFKLTTTMCQSAEMRITLRDTHAQMRRA
jgi:hypothetical protein